MDPGASRPASACLVPVSEKYCAVQERIDTLDKGKRFVDPEWHDWGDVEEGGVTKPSTVLL